MTAKDSVADSGDGHTESGPPRVMKRCSMKMCQTEYGKRAEGEGGTRQEEKRHPSRARGIRSCFWLFNNLISSWMHVGKIALLGSRKVYSI